MTSHTEKAARHAGWGDAIEECPFKAAEQVEALAIRRSPYFHVLLTGRHIGFHRPNVTCCNWTAPVLTGRNLYRQKCLGPAPELGRGSLSFEEVLGRANTWFESPEISAIAVEPQGLVPNCALWGVCRPALRGAE